MFPIVGLVGLGTELVKSLPRLRSSRELPRLPSLSDPSVSGDPGLEPGPPPKLALLRGFSPFGGAPNFLNLCIDSA